MRKFIYIALLMMVSCGYDRFGDMDREDFGGTDMLPDTDLSMLRDNYFGTPYTINQPLTIGGYVTANDLSGNFFRSFVIDDGTGSIEVNAGFYDLHNYYQVGRRVVIRAEGLAVGMYNGVIQLGYKINSYGAHRVEEFGSRHVMERYVTRDVLFSAPEPMPLDIVSVEDSYCGRLVRIGNLHATEEDAGQTWAYPASGGAPPAMGLRAFCDTAGNTIAVTTSGYASFAGETVPAGTVAITGILMKGKFGGGADVFAVKLRDLADVEIE